MEQKDWCYLLEYLAGVFTAAGIMVKGTWLIVAVLLLLLRIYIDDCICGN